MSPLEASEVCQRIRKINAAARILPCSRGQVSPAALLCEADPRWEESGVIEEASEDGRSGHGHGHEGAGSEHEFAHGHGHADIHGGVEHSREVSTFSLVRPGRDKIASSSVKP